tara:strand:- start:2811 stop:3089 length:279 start_codon:yes stop_codon:yes gene_type:complete
MKKIYKNKNTTYSTLRDSSIILNEDTSEYLQLNDTAKIIFELLDEGDTREVLKSKLRGIFDDPNKNLDIQLDEFLEDAIEKKIIFEELDEPK